MTFHRKMERLSRYANAFKRTSPTGIILSKLEFTGCLRSTLYVPLNPNDLNLMAVTIIVNLDLKINAFHKSLSIVQATLA